MVREQVIWTDPDSGQLNLNDWVNYFCPRDRSGVWAPPYTLSSTKMPLSEGSQFKSVSVGESGVDLNVIIRAADRDALRLLLRDLSHRMDPTRGEGQLKIVNGEETRILYCRPEGIKKVVGNDRIAKTPISFTANDPYWYSDTIISTVIENTNTTIYKFFSSSFFPIKLINSIAYAVRALNNPGDVASYPIWTITGPGETITLRNLTTGKNLAFDSLTLLEGQELIIDTRTGIKTIEIDGENQFSKIDSLSSLWKLEVGNNDLVIQMTNSSINSKIQINFTPRYLTP